MSYLKNGWYCAGFSHDLTDSPIALTIMEQPIALFRRANGKPAAVSDRCPHRFAPLSMGTVRGDNIACPYHGLEFDGDGQCRRNPHGDGKIPKAACVRSYPLVERDSVLWIWMGERSLADPDQIVALTDFFDMERHDMVYGQFTLKANYQLVADNLMDLSHAPYLHAGSLSNGEGDVAQLDFDMKQSGNTVTALHRMRSTPPTPQFKPFWRSESELCDFRADMCWNPPSNLQLDVGITGVGRPPEEGPYLHMVHLLTPISPKETLYSWAAARNFEVGNIEVSQVLKKMVDQAFTTEDLPVIEAAQKLIGDQDPSTLTPVLLIGDAAAVRVGRIIQQLIAKETKPEAATT